MLQARIVTADHTSIEPWRGTHGTPRPGQESLDPQNGWRPYSARFKARREIADKYVPVTQ
jgi:hypothetical protein